MNRERERECPARWVSPAERAAVAADKPALARLLSGGEARGTTVQSLINSVATSAAPYDRVLDCMVFLMGRGAILEPDCRRPIEAAVLREIRLDAVRALLHLGAKPDTFHQPTPLERVCSATWVAGGMSPEAVHCARALVEAGARIRNGWSGPLGVAIRCGEVELVLDMLRAGASRRWAERHLSAACLPPEEQRALEAALEAAPEPPRKRRRAKGA